jgi:histidinol-phosphate aminotransferase
MKINVEKYIRPNCKGFEPYVAGRPIDEIKRELGLKKVIKLASNENPLGPSKKAIAAIKKAASRVYFYPDANSFSLKKAIAGKFKINPQNIILGSGSDEIIELVAKAFLNPGEEMVVSEHAFIRYKMAGNLMNAKVIGIPMINYTHDLNAMAEAVTSKTKLIFIANPNNPSGTYNNTKEVVGFLNKISKKQRPPLVVFDEAYYEYAKSLKDYPDTLKLLSAYPNIIILRTFSKIYGLAGLRAGYGFASKEIVDYLDRIRPPFNINIPAQEAAAVSLNDKTQVSKSLKMVAEGKKYIYSELKKAGIAFLPSAANFVLMDVSPMLGKDVFKELLKNGIIVRAMDEYNYFNHIRVTIDTPKNNRYFISKLKQLLGKGK